MANRQRYVDTIGYPALEVAYALRRWCIITAIGVCAAAASASFINTMFGQAERNIPAGSGGRDPDLDQRPGGLNPPAESGGHGTGVIVLEPAGVSGVGDTPDLDSDTTFGIDDVD